MSCLNGDPPGITSTLDGFSVGGMSVSWSSIATIKAFKLDLLSADLFYFEIEVDGRDRYVQLCEDWPGFKAVSDEFESRLSFPAGWWDAVVKSAFKTNETLLYRRS